MPDEAKISSARLEQAASLLGLSTQQLQAVLSTISHQQALTPPSPTLEYAQSSTPGNATRHAATQGAAVSQVGPATGAREQGSNSPATVFWGLNTPLSNESAPLHSHKSTMSPSDHVLNNHEVGLSLLNSEPHQHTLASTSGQDVDDFLRYLDSSHAEPSELVWQTTDNLPSPHRHDTAQSESAAVVYTEPDLGSLLHPVSDDIPPGRTSTSITGIDWEDLAAEQLLTVTPQAISEQVTAHTHSIHQPPTDPTPDQVQSQHMGQSRFWNIHSKLDHSSTRVARPHPAIESWESFSEPTPQTLREQLATIFSHGQENQLTLDSNQALPLNTFQFDDSQVGDKALLELDEALGRGDPQQSLASSAETNQQQSNSQPSPFDPFSGLAASHGVSSFDFACNLAFNPMMFSDQWEGNTQRDMTPIYDLPRVAAPLQAADEAEQPDETRVVRANRLGPQRVPKRGSKRKTYLDHELQQTNLTRSIRGCMRCRQNRKRCIPDPNDPRGPCLTCQKTTFNTFNLPCLRYKITDSILHRNTTQLHWNQQHPMIGPRYGDFHQTKDWTNDVIKTFEITQDRGTILYLRVRQFNPPGGEGYMDTKGLAGKGRDIYAIPWAIIDAESGLKSINAYIDESMDNYIYTLIDPSKTLVLMVFRVALGLAKAPEPVPVLQDVLRLWTATRFIEGGWRCYGEDKLGAEKLRNPLRPSWWVSLPPYVDYQFASIVMQRVLDPLRNSVLKALERMVNANKPSNWFCIFLVTFILLYNYELNTAFEVKFSVKRKLEVRYPDMTTINATQSGSKTLLAHFHYICKGNVPFQPGFDWTSASALRMAQLDRDQVAFIEEFRQELERNADVLSNVSEELYDDDYWFTSQLFQPSWTPRDTHEYSPPLVLS